MIRGRRLALLAVASLAALGRPALAAGGWASLGPDGATIHAVAVAPRDPRVVYAGGEHGMFASTDGGANWRRSTRGLPGIISDDLRIQALAVDPARPATVYAGGTGGVFRSVDGGASWRATGPGPSAPIVLIAHPRTSGTLYAAGPGVFKTMDGGAHWTNLSAGLPAGGLGLQTLALDAASSTLYAGVGDQGVWKKTGGGIWQPASGGALDRQIVTALALDPLHPRTLWAAVINGPVYKTTDGGARWRPAGRITVENNYVSALLSVPTRKGMLLAADGIGLYRSANGGATWGPVGGSPGGAFGIAYAPSDPRIVFAGTRDEGGHGGVYVSRNGGANFIFSSRGVSTRTVTALHAETERIWLGDSSQGLYLSPDRGAHWGRLSSFPVRLVGDVDVDPRDSRNVVVAASALHASHDRGATWQSFGAAASQVAFDPQDPRTVYAGGRGLLKSADRGDTYVRLAVPEPGLDVTALAAARATTLYVAGQTPAGPGGVPAAEARLLRSTDGGATWTRIDAGLPAAALALAVDPASPATVYAGTQEGVWKSTDGGGHWVHASHGLPDGGIVYALAAAPSDPDTLYVALALQGIWKSTDGGAGWSPLGAPPGDLSDLLVLELAVAPDDPGRVYAGTFEAGLFVYVP